jgi:hypothetical protein
VVDLGEAEAEVTGLVAAWEVGQDGVVDDGIGVERRSAPKGARHGETV